MNQVDPAKTRIGWIGAGVMGRSMCAHLIRAGFSTTVHSRTRDKAQSLLDAGAQWAASPREVAGASDVVFSIVGFPDEVRQIVLGRDGLLAGSHPGQVFVDMTTSSPTQAEEIYNLASPKGVHALDAPVSGGDVGARNGTLSVMVGGDREVCQRLDPCWRTFAKTVVFQGPAGSGQHTKMVNQTLIATNMIGVCEALLYAYRAGLNLDDVLKSVSSGAAGSWSLTNLAPRIMNNDFEPGFFVQHFVKDMAIALDEANRMGLALPGLALAHQLYVALQSQGKGHMGTQALHLALASLSGVDWFQRSTSAVDQLVSAALDS
jgi:3-hydroxyisobutyrate dehydrogenase